MTRPAARHRARRARLPLALVAAALAVVSVPVALTSSPPEVTSAAFSDAARGRTTITTSAQWAATSPTALALSNTTARVTWVAAEGHTTYTVQRATNSGFTSGLATYSSVNGTTLEATSLAQNTTYYFRVRGATNSKLPWSAVASAKTGPGSSVAKVALMTASDLGGTPHGIVVDGEDRVWVAEYTNGSLLRVPAAGGTVTRILDKKFPDASLRQIALSPSATNVAMVVNVEDSNPGAQSGSDGVWMREGTTGVVRKWSDPAPYGITYSASRARYYVAGVNADGQPARSVFECTTAWVCTRIWDSPSWMSYLSIPKNSNKLVVGTSNRIYAVDVTAKTATTVATLGGDVRGVFSPTENLYFVAEYDQGLIWRLQYVPSTGATNSQLILTGVPVSRAMATTSTGDLIIANNSTAGSGLRGVWKYPGLGK